MAVRAFLHDATARGLLTSALCRGAWFVFPGMASVLHCGDCADGPRPVGIVAVAGEGTITDADVPEPGCTLHLRVVAPLFLLTTPIEFLILQFSAARHKDHGTRFHRDNHQAT